MKNKWMWAGLILCALMFLGCTWNAGGIPASGRVVRESRELEGFHAVEFAMVGTLHVEVGEIESLEIEADEKLLPYITAEVNDGTLVLRMEPHVVSWNNHSVNLYVTVRELDVVALRASGDAVLPDLQADRLILTVAGSGDLKTGQLDVRMLETHLEGSGGIDIARAAVAEQQQTVIRGSGDLRIGELTTDSLSVFISASGGVTIVEGTAQVQQVVLAGSGDYQAAGLQNAEAQIEVRGSGAAYTSVAEHLSVKIAGSGDVHCTGQPTVDRLVTGSGEVVITGN